MLRYGLSCRAGANKEEWHVIEELRQRPREGEEDLWAADPTGDDRAVEAIQLG